MVRIGGSHPPDPGSIPGRGMPLLFLSLRSLVFDMPNTTALSFRLDGRAVQGAGFRHQSLRRRGFKSHSNHKLFFFCDVEKNLNVLPCSESSSELAQRKRVGLITQRSQDRNLDSLTLSRLAQLVERKTLNLVVVGSSPTVGKLLWRSWQRVGLIILRSPVRSRPGAG